MELINKEELLHHKFLPEQFNLPHMDSRVYHYQKGWNAAIDTLYDNLAIIKAVPIDRIKELRTKILDDMPKYTSLAEVEEHDEVFNYIVEYHGYILDLLNEIITKNEG